MFPIGNILRHGTPPIGGVGEPAPMISEGLSQSIRGNRRACSDDFGGAFTTHYLYFTPLLYHVDL